VGNVVSIKGRPQLRVVKSIRKVSVDAIRAALHEAEDDLEGLKALKTASPGYDFGDGTDITDRIAAKMRRIEELKRDLHGDC
jgi:hypothetical protein